MVSVRQLLIFRKMPSSWSVLLKRKLYVADLLFCHVQFSAPAPSNVQNILATKCQSRNQNKSQFFYVRPAGGCDKIDDLQAEGESRHLTDRNVVFAFQVPVFNMRIFNKFLTEISIAASSSKGWCWVGLLSLDAKSDWHSSDWCHFL